MILSSLMRQSEVQTYANTSKSTPTMAEQITRIMKANLPSGLFASCLVATRLPASSKAIHRTVIVSNRMNTQIFYRIFTISSYLDRQLQLSSTSKLISCLHISQGNLTTALCCRSRRGLQRTIHRLRQLKWTNWRDPAHRQGSTKTEFCPSDWFYRQIRHSLRPICSSSTPSVGRVLPNKSCPETFIQLFNGQCVCLRWF